MKIYLVRHGQTSWNVRGIAQGRTNIPLNAIGIQQAQNLRAKISDLPITHCYSSPLARARHTAEILTDDRHIDIVLDELLLERGFGEYEGKPGIKMREKNQDIGNLRQNISPHGMESIRSTFDRADRFLNMLRQKHHDNDAILVVAHGSILKCVHFAIDGYDDDLDYWSWHMQNCEIYEHNI